MKLVKPISALCLALLVSSCCVCPMLTLPRASVTVEVVDETGTPVPDAEVGVMFMRPASYGNPWAGSAPHVKEGRTDRKGRFSASTWALDRIGVGASRKGYYDSGETTRHAGGHRRTVCLVLRKIHNPIPMYAKRLDEVELPVLNKPVGYDLTKGDWVKPHGAGEHGDLVFTGVRDERHMRDFDISLTISTPGGGLCPIPASDVHSDSALKLPHEAPEDGYDTTELVHKWVIGPNRPGMRTASSDAENFFFRVRTELDEQGGIAGAQYGKLMGPIDYHRMKGATLTVKFSYYLNPTPNDRNVECGSSLFKGLNFFQKVQGP